jgi:integrase/recombinase XerC
MARVDDNDGPVIEKLLDHYTLYAKAAGFSQAQINNVRTSLRLFDRFLGGITDIGKVTVDDFRRFIADIRTRPAWQGLKTEKQRNLSTATINTYARTIKTFFHWLQKESFITENPLESVPLPPIGERMSKAYSEDQMKAVLDAASFNARDKAIFYSFIDSGLRLDELSNLKISDVDLKKSCVKVLGKGKGKKERYIYLGHHALEAIDSYIKESRRESSDNDFLIVKGNGKPLTNSGIRSMLLRLGDKIGFQGRLSPHRLRHTFATLSLNYGATREELQKEMGHSNPETTEGYLHVPDSDIGTAHQRFSPISNLIRSRVVKVLPETKILPVPNLSQEGKVPSTQSCHSTQVEEQIRGLAEQIKNSISLPWVKDTFIPQLQPGRHTLGKNGLPIYITEEGRIKLTFSILNADDADLITQALYSHLETGGSRDILSKILMWCNGIGEYLLSCHTLLTEVRNDMEGTYGFYIPTNQDENAGFIFDYPILVCADAVDQARGFKHFSGYRYSKDGLKLKFGGYIIYGGTPNENLEYLEKIHNNLRIHWAKRKQTGVVARRCQELEEQATVINRQLQKILALKKLPGYCELCVVNQ